MTRTFRSLAGLVLLLLLGAIAVGFWSFFLPRPTPFQKDIFLIHFYLGLGAALVILLVHCIVFTYFLGTGRWVKEVTLAYRMPDEPWHKETRELKRKAFPPALFSMLIAIAAAAAGAGVQLQAWHWTAHATLAFATLAINLWAFGVEHRCVTRNAEVLQGVLVEVDRIRRESGLNTNAEALVEDDEVAASSPEGKMD